MVFIRCYYKISNIAVTNKIIFNFGILVFNILALSFRCSDPFENEANYELKKICLILSPRIEVLNK